MLTYASLLLVCGRLGDLLGHRIVFQLGLLLAGCGLGACALAPGFELLLLARVLQGVGVALMLSCAPALATFLYAERHRVRVLAVYAALMAVGSALGPLAGGVLVEAHGWSAVFWARVPLVAAALVLSTVIPARQGHGAASGLDTLGSAQLAVALCCALGGLSLLVDATLPAGPLALVVAGLAALALFIRRQARHAAPVIRPGLFRDARFALMNAASVIANLAAFSVVLLVPFYLIGIARLDAGSAGVLLALAAVGTILGSAIAPRAVRRYGAVATAGIGMVLSSAGLAGIGCWPEGATAVLMSSCLIIQGLGLGLFQVAYTDLVTETLPPSERGVAGSLTMLTRSIGIACGASALSLVHRTFEQAAAVALAGERAAFMAGFGAVFLGAAALQLAAVAVGAGAAMRACAPDVRR